MSRPTQEQALAVAFDHAESSAFYSDELRQRVANELHRMRIASCWIPDTMDRFARKWAHTGGQVGWVNLETNEDGEWIWVGRVAGMVAGKGEDQVVVRDYSAQKARQWVDLYLMRELVVLVGGSECPSP